MLKSLKNMLLKSEIEWSETLKHQDLQITNCERNRRSAFETCQETENIEGESIGTEAGME